MPMKKRFYHVNGQMMAYDEGGVTKDFLTDHLGSITAEIDQNQNRTFETRYSAYGRNNWSTGTGCGFGWVGSFGYRETGLFHMSHYVRARHYSYLTGNWSTVDPLWPDESAYGYVGGRATTDTDIQGTGCNITIKGVLNNLACTASCGWNFICPNYCDALGQWHFRLTIQRKGCTGCKLYQWFKDGKKWQRDIAPPRNSWPVFTYKDGEVENEFHDYPSDHWRDYGCETHSVKVDFITCFCCKEGAKCVSWGYSSNFPDCKSAKCTKYGPVLVAPSFSKQICDSTAGGRL